MLSTGGVSVNCVNRAGCCGLFKATLNSKPEIVRFLLYKRGIDVNVTFEGKTLLAVAVELARWDRSLQKFLGSDDIVRLLLQNGADLSVLMPAALSTVLPLIASGGVQSPAPARQLPTPPPTRQLPTPPPPLPPDWEEVFDEDQQRAYYYNSRTSRTSWERPDSLETENLETVALSPSGDDHAHAEEVAPEEVASEEPAPSEEPRWRSRAELERKLVELERQLAEQSAEHVAELERKLAGQVYSLLFLI